MSAKFLAFKNASTFRFCAALDGHQSSAKKSIPLLDACAMARSATWGSAESTSVGSVPWEGTRCWRRVPWAELLGNQSESYAPISGGHTEGGSVLTAAGGWWIADADIAEPPTAMHAMTATMTASQNT